MSNVTVLTQLREEVSELAKLVRQIAASPRTITATITAAAPEPSEPRDPATLREFSDALDRLPPELRGKFYAKHASKFFA